MSSTHNILVIAHGHPDFSLGGGEIAAYHLFKHYQQHPAVAQATFLARVEDPAGVPTGHLCARRKDEYIWYQGLRDLFWQGTAHRDSLRTRLPDLLRALKPSIIHLHHYFHLGLDILTVIRNVLPDVRIYLTLHEYIAICHHHGLMVKPNSLELCKQSSPQDCHRCYPERSIEDFWLRQEFFRDRLAVVDGFIAPSDFLRDRYISWGIAAEQIVTIENGQPESNPLPSRAGGEVKNRFAFFGQVNPYKGLDVLLKALTVLPKEAQERLVLEVHAAHFEKQSRELRRRIERLLNPLVESGVVQWMGPYRPEDMRQRLAKIDWVVVPSVWWENSPLVIQEAFGAGRPVICSNIGGMAEKVRDGVDGLHVPVANVLEWAQKFTQVMDQPDLWDQLVRNIRPVFSHAQSAEAHLAAFAAWR